MLKKITKRIVSFLTAAVTTVSNVMPIVPIRAVDGEQDLTYQSIELYPNGEETEQVITLDGMMPEGAEAAAFDVSEDYEGVAAYDISISSKLGDYQPGEENPILVEITAPVITEHIELWHIHDDGYREQIPDFTAADGKVSFYATGFSVYEIVEPILDVDISYPVVAVEGESEYGVYEINTVPANSGFSYNVEKKLYKGTANKLTSLAEFKAHIGDGLYIKSYHNRYANNAKAKVDNNGRIGITVTAPYTTGNDTTNMTNGLLNGASKYYFAAVDPNDTSNNLYCIYTYEDENDPSTIKYVAQSGTNSLALLDSLDSISENMTAQWELEYLNNTFRIKAVRNNESYYWTSKDNAGLAAYKVASATNGETFTFWL